LKLVRRTLLLAALLLLAPGCHAAHLTGGQLSIWWGREPIEEVLESGDVTPDHMEKLRLVQKARLFAIETIDLKRTDSYTYFFDTGEGYPAWNVSASLPDAFASYVWWFPVVGHIPYAGFFDPRLAVLEARRLAAEGYDTITLPVPAYSTLGWFDDPVFSSMLDDPEETLVSTVIHEMAHATVWVDGDVTLNENLAQFIGDRGAEAFFFARGGKDDPALVEARRQKRDTERFTSAVLELKDELSRVYEATGKRSSKLAFKQRAITAFRRRYLHELRPHLSDDSWDWVLDSRIDFNNAVLLTFARYHGDEELFSALFERCGGDLRELVRALQELAEEDDPRAALEARAGSAK
jgi:predicted aminopeptidase